MAILTQTWHIYMRNLKTWIGQPALVVPSVVFPAFFFLLFAAPLSGVTNLPEFPTDDYEAYMTGTILVMSVVFSGADAAMAILADILSGYFDKLLLAPINRLSILLSSLLMAGTRALFQVVIILAIALALGVSFKGGVAGVLLIALLATVLGMAWACVGLMIAIKTKSAQVTQSSWLLFMPVAFLTTAYMPKDFLSGWFEWAVKINPVDYVLNTIRTIVIAGWEWSGIMPGLWVLTGMTVLAVTVATWMYRRETA
jgi:ABC-2 type transport system permease protein